jgi:hypothetical protein
MPVRDEVSGIQTETVDRRWPRWERRPSGETLPASDARSELASQDLDAGDKIFIEDPHELPGFLVA